MIQIRNQIFETNSSSVHTITLCHEKKFKDWENGNLIYDIRKGELITLEEAEERKKQDYSFPYHEYEENDHRFFTYAQFFDSYDYDDYLGYMEKYHTHENIDGVDIIAFGYYGHD